MEKLSNYCPLKITELMTFKLEEEKFEILEYEDHDTNVTIKAKRLNTQFTITFKKFHDNTINEPIGRFFYRDHKRTESRFNVSSRELAFSSKHFNTNCINEDLVEVFKRKLEVALRLLSQK